MTAPAAHAAPRPRRRHMQAVATAITTGSNRPEAYLVAFASASAAPASIRRKSRARLPIAAARTPSQLASASIATAIASYVANAPIEYSAGRAVEQCRCGEHEKQRKHPRGREASVAVGQGAEGRVHDRRTGKVTLERRYRRSVQPV